MKGIAATTVFFVCLLSAGEARSSYWHYRYCTPDNRERCNDDEPTITVKSRPATSGFGPFVCKYEETSTMYAYDYVWEGSNCRTYWYFKYCSSYDCVRSTTCSNHKSKNRYYDCCPGYSINNTATRDSDEYQNELMEQGCPPEREDLRICLPNLGLNEIAGIIAASAMFNDSMPFTLFAPTDEAIRNAGVSDEATEEFLAAHVLSMMVYGDKFSDGQRLPGLVPDTFIHITKIGENRVFASGAEIIQKDACFVENGVVHVVNGTIATDVRSVTTVIEETSTLSTFNRLLDAAGYTDDLNGEKVYTVFAPTDAAFEGLTVETGLNIVDCLLSSSCPEDTLKRYVLYHVTKGAEYTSTLIHRDTVTTTSCRWRRRYGRSWNHCHGYRCHWSYWDCDSLSIQVGDEGISVGSADTDLSTIEMADIAANNGVIHTITPPLSHPSIDLSELCADFPALDANVN